MPGAHRRAPGIPGKVLRRGVLARPGSRPRGPGQEVVRVPPYDPIVAIRSARNASGDVYDVPEPAAVRVDSSPSRAPYTIRLWMSASTTDLQRYRRMRCPPFPGYHLYYPSRRHFSPAFALLVDALRDRR